MILEAGDNRGDELSSNAADGDSSGLDEYDSPGPEARTRLEGRAFLDLLCGTGEGARGPIRIWYLLNPRGSSGTASGTGSGTGPGTGAGTGACASCSGVIILTRGLRRDLPLVRTMSVDNKGHRGRARQCTLSNWTRAYA